VTGLFSKIFGTALLLLGLLAGGPQTAAAGEVPMPNPVKAFKGDKCVEPADVMRREHMDFLKHQRIETVHEGVRGKKYSLRGCIDCHAVPDEQAGGKRTARAFCSDCHKYAAVNIDCFQCHTTKPDDAKSAKAMPTGPLPPGHPIMKTTSNTAEKSWKRKLLMAELLPDLSERNACNVQVR